MVRLFAALLYIAASWLSYAAPRQYGNIELLPVPCPQAAIIALSYLEKKGIAANPADPNLFTLNSKHPRDDRGGQINAFLVSKKYTQKLDSLPVGSWMTYNQLSLSGKLKLSSVGNGCQVELHYEYYVYAVQWIVLVPADGDYTSLPSNKRLESEHLAGIKKAACQTSTCR